MTAFILASSSPRRRELLSSLGITFTVIKPDVPEVRRDGEPPLDYIARLSVEKASAVADRLMVEEDTESSLILAADTTVILAGDTLGIQSGDILEKPATPDEARSMLRRLREGSHVAATALTLLKVQRQPNGQHTITYTDTQVTLTTVIMRPYTDDEIEASIASGIPFDKAGAYAIQDTAFNPVARYEGSYTNIVGLPLETLKIMLARLDTPSFT